MSYFQLSNKPNKLPWTNLLQTRKYAKISTVTSKVEQKLGGEFTRSVG